MGRNSVVLSKPCDCFCGDYANGGVNADRFFHGHIYGIGFLARLYLRWVWFGRDDWLAIFIMGKLLRFPIERCRKPDEVHCIQCGEICHIAVYTNSGGPWCMACEHKNSWGDSETYSPRPPDDEGPGAA